jgi:hypothetical protein
MRANERATQRHNMFSHIVIFWANPGKPQAADALLAGAKQYLQPIPGALHFHVGKMARSHRPVVDQSYAVALNLVFPDKAAQDAYQAHPLHLEFVEQVLRPHCAKVLVYDFE